MPAKPFLVVSDVHLGAGAGEREPAFRDFLRHAAESASGLLINGDLFDAWMATRHFVVRHHVRVLAAMAEVVESGVPIYLVGGNHDPIELGGHALQDLGVTVLTEPARLELGGWRALVIHGDGVQRAGPPYPAYLKRHAVLRSAPVRWSAQRLLHLDRLYEAIAGWSETPDQVLRAHGGGALGPRPDAEPIAAWATAALAAEPGLDVVLAGHSHLPVTRETAPGRWYVNSGDWVAHMSYVVLPADRGAPELRSWPDAPLASR